MKDDLKQYLEAYGAAVDEMQGVEKTEEDEEDYNFIKNILMKDLDWRIAATMFLLATAPDEIASSLYALYACGALVYREWLIERGVDVRALEGR